MLAIEILLTRKQAENTMSMECHLVFSLRLLSKWRNNFMHWQASRIFAVFLVFTGFVVTAVPSIAPATALAAAQNAQIDDAVKRGVSFLKSNFGRTNGGRKSLAALALLKGGEPPSSAEITKAVEEIRRKIKKGTYQALPNNESIYAAGVNITLLADIDANRYRDEILAIAEYIIAQQGVGGDWDYPKRTVGDTSISQYGMLGLWAAERARISIPAEIYEKAVAWHLRTQMHNGGFAYHPGTTEGTERGAPTLSMTAAGVSSLLIARLYLFPRMRPGSWEDGGRRARRSKQEPAKTGLKFGVLEKVDIELDADERQIEGALRSAAPLKSFDSAIRKALGWLTVNFRDIGSNPHRMYYYYTLERMTALANIRQIGKHDWFEVCSTRVLRMQEDNGSWKTFTGPIVGTSLAIMFLTKSTAKLLGRGTSVLVGSGLMVGGRGDLPTDLSAVRVKNGELVKRKSTGPLDELLGQLEQPQSLLVQDVQTAIVEKVQLGDRQALIGQRDRLLKLVEHPDVEVRRTVLWALGRCGKLVDAKVVIGALEDSDIDVAIEARNALCWISRKPHGFGLPETPLKEIAEDATEAERRAAIDKWRSEALRKWRQWYRTVRPYDERDDLSNAVGR